MIIRYQGDHEYAVEARGHKITVGLTPELGGTDKGMMPPELFAASFGSCIGVYVVSYLQKVGIPAEGMTIEVTYDKVTEPKTRIGGLRAVINIPGGVPEERRSAVLRAAENCMIHNTLGHPPQVEIKLA